MSKVLKEYHSKGKVSKELWINDKGLTHRDDGEPSSIRYYESGSVAASGWFVNGIPNRKDGPSHITYYEDGTVNVESWYYYDKLNRLDGPAFVTYSEDGSIYQEVWCVNGKYHREDGPACIHNNIDDPHVEWHLKGNDITEEVNWWIERNNIRHWSEWTNKEKAFFKLKFVR